MKKRTAISLFTGAGGMDLGFTQAGFNIVVANEIDPDAGSTFLAFHKGKIPLLPGSIDDDETFGSITQHQGVEMVFGGPPCQGFSVAGKMNPDDERNHLIWRFFDVVEATEPAAFVLENVKALGAFSRWSDVRQRMHERAKQLGYLATILILNAKDFGVPQARERMFMVGIADQSTSVANVASLREQLIGQLERQKAEAPTIRSIIEGLGRAGSERNHRTCNAIITYAKNPVLRPSPYAGMLFNGAGRPVRPWGHSCTLPASMGGNKTPIVDEAEIFDGKDSFVERYHKHLMRGGKPRQGKADKRLRRLTIEECLAIQTFPSDYPLAGRQSAAYRQIGNAVPCRLARAVAIALREVLETCGRRGRVRPTSN